MKKVDSIRLGTSKGKYKGTVEIAIAPTGDLFLTLFDEEPEEEERVEGSFYLTRENGKLLAAALTNAAARQI